MISDHLGKTVNSHSITGGIGKGIGGILSAFVKPYIFPKNVSEMSNPPFSQDGNYPVYKGSCVYITSLYEVLKLFYR